MTRTSYLQNDNGVINSWKNSVFGFCCSNVKRLTDTEKKLFFKTISEKISWEICERFKPKKAIGASN